MLWFAWKIVLLQYRKQHAPSPDGRKPCCDLLEKSYFCSIANNHHNLRQIERMVVICLKNRTFAVSQTTHGACHPQTYQLWFAWKIVLLQYRKQLYKKDYNDNRVVICLKNRTFAVSQTTPSLYKRTIERLWFAWKIVLLQYRKQLQKWPLT